MLSVAPATSTATAPLSLTTLKTFLLAFDIIILDIQVHRDNYYDVTKRGPKNTSFVKVRHSGPTLYVPLQKESQYSALRRLQRALVFL